MIEANLRPGDIPRGGGSQSKAQEFLKTLQPGFPKGITCMLGFGIWIK